MRFKTGFVLGFATGWWLATSKDDETRRQLEEKFDQVVSNPRFDRIRETVSRNVGQVGDAVESRVTDVTDAAGDAVESAVAPGNGGAATTRNPSPG